MSRHAMDDTGAIGGEDPFLDPSVVAIPTIRDPWTIDKALAAISVDWPTESSSSPVAFFHLLERLKLTHREGWKRFGIDRGESVADHMYRMAIMVMVPPPSLAPRLDLAKCVKMCLVHDMAESLVGDITPADGIPKPEKNRREALTMNYIRELLGNCGSSGEDILAVWQEFEDSKTLESRFVQDMDKVELLLQMVEYEKRGHGNIDLSEFTYAGTKLFLPETKLLAEEVLKEREKFWDGKKRAVEGSVSSRMRKMQDEYYGNQ